MKSFLISIVFLMTPISSLAMSRICAHQIVSRESSVSDRESLLHKYLNELRQSESLVPILENLSDRSITKTWTISILRKFGFASTQLRAVKSVIKKLQLQMPEDLAWAQLGIELVIQQYLAENYFNEEIASLELSDPLHLRRPYAGWSLSEIGNQLHAKLQNMNLHTDVELAAASYNFESLFKPTYVDGISTRVRLDIARWLTGPYAKIETSEDLRQVILSYKLKFPYGHVEARQQCGRNLDKMAELAQKGVFLLPIHNSEAYFGHTYLVYYNFKGEKILVDFSFNQFFLIDVLGRNPFVGTIAEMSELVHLNKYNLGVAINVGKRLKLTGSPSTLLGFFNGVPSTAGYSDITFSHIQRLQTRLVFFQSLKDQ